MRAKDISLLFYDSGSGPRSSSIIGQGNIDQIINYLIAQNIKIFDISTDDGDLEDVFLRLTKN